MENTYLSSLAACYSKIAKLFDVLSRPNNYRILEEIDKKPKTFSDLMFELRKNPNVISTRLKKLSKLNLVEKSNEGYQITQAGKLALEIDKHNIDDTRETAEEIMKLMHMTGVV
jgi:predicted transcriptional regulator